MSHEKQESLFGDAPPLSDEDDRIVEAYREIGIPVDRLVASKLLSDRFANAVRSRGDKRQPEELLQRLMNLRKAGRLPRIGRMQGRVVAPSVISFDSAEMALTFAGTLIADGVDWIRLMVLDDGSVQLAYRAPSGEP